MTTSPDTPVPFGSPLHLTAFTDADADAFRTQMGRPARGVLAVAYRCAHRIPAVVQTAPRLPDGTPFPTMFYLCCSALTAAASRMESAGVMGGFNEELAADPQLAAGHARAHRAYLQVRNSVADLGIDVSAGGMPDRVKCLHVLLAHTLACGPGVNPLGDRTLALLPEYVRGAAPCVPVPQVAAADRILCILP